MATMRKIEPHLYQLDHVTKGGEVSTRYYAKFVTWDRQALTKPLGSNIAGARMKLQRLRDLNQARVRVELDEEKELRVALERQKKQKEDARKGITLSEWAQRYFNELLPVNKRGSTVRGERLRLKTLIEHFGDVPLCEIDLEKISAYRRARSGDAVTHATINRCVSF